MVVAPISEVLRFLSVAFDLTEIPRAWKGRTATPTAPAMTAAKLGSKASLLGPLRKATTLAADVMPAQR